MTSCSSMISCPAGLDRVCRIRASGSVRTPPQGYTGKWMPYSFYHKQRRFARRLGDLFRSKWGISFGANLNDLVRNKLMDSLFCGKATAVATVRRTAASAAFRIHLPNAHTQKRETPVGVSRFWWGKVDSKTIRFAANTIYSVLMLRNYQQRHNI